MKTTYLFSPGSLAKKCQQRLTARFWKGAPNTQGGTIILFMHTVYNVNICNVNTGLTSCSLMSNTRKSMNRRLYRKWAKAVVLPIFTLILMLSLVLAMPTVSWAADASSNQALNQSASLLAPDPDAKITVYLQPEVNKDQAGYGVNGDAVTVLEQVSDNQSLTWNHIRFDNSPYAEGWVQETFLALTAGKATKAAPQGQNQQPAASSGIDSPSGSQYLGNRQSQSGQRSQSQYSQQSQFNQRQPFNQQKGTQSYSQRNQN